MKSATWWVNGLYELQIAFMHMYPRIFCDETPMPVLDPEGGRPKTCQFWAHATDDRAWKGPAPPAVAYVFAASRGKKEIVEQLSTFTGVLQVDAYGAYKALAKDKRAAGEIKLAFCLAHYLENCFIWSTSVRMPRPKLFLLRRTLDKIGGSTRGRRGARRHHCRYRCGRHQPSRHMSPVRSGGTRDFGVAPSTLTAVAPYPVMEPTSG
jgi:hypothetical protein